MRNILAEIVERKRSDLKQIREKVKLADLIKSAEQKRDSAVSHRLRTALLQNSINIISEIKRASPSKGEIRPDTVPGLIARDYEEGGACAISVLTEEHYFRGSLDDLRSVRESVKLPLLRKDFTVDEFQIYEAAAAGADAILLIVAALSDRDLQTLLRLTEEDLGMDALVEVHTVEELKRAVQSGATIIGVNNRDLRDFNVSLTVSEKIAGEAPSDSILISESGINTGQDISHLRSLGFKGFLIGETLMRAKEPGTALRNLIREAQ
jgi:indole-3-glycerol phosphate synthase